MSAPIRHTCLLAAFAMVLSTTAPAISQNFVLQSSVIGSGAVNGSSTNFDLQGTVGQSAIGTGSSTNFDGSWGFWYTVGAGSVAEIFANLKMFLEGPFSSGSMLTDVTDVLPTSQPFTGSPWNYSGGESVSTADTSPNNGVPDFFDNNTDIVDWVFVQLRNGDPTVEPMNVVAQRAGFLLSDGTVVDTDGTTALSFSGIGSGDYFVVVDHLNHTSAMSVDSIAVASDTVAHDFTTALAQAYTTGPAPMKNLGSGNFGLFTGDYNGDGNILADDFTAWLSDTRAGASGYQDSDFNRDRFVTVPDFLLWLANTRAGAASQVPSQ